MTARDEAVERMAALLCEGAGWGPLADLGDDLREHWIELARIALVSHPAVEALDRLSGTCRDYIDYRDTQVAGELYRAIMERTEESRTILAAIKEK